MLEREVQALSPSYPTLSAGLLSTKPTFGTSKLKKTLKLEG